jgi:nickel-type superoxide dismutase maturation protease
MIFGRLSPLWFYRIAGDSMRPNFLPDDITLGLCWFVPAVGQVVVARLPDRRIIKRIARLERDQVWIQGDNPDASIDSRSFGPLSRRQLEAVIVAKLPASE